MASPRRGGPQGGPPKPKHNWVNKVDPNSRRRTKLLDKRKENYFRYDMEDLLKMKKVAENQIAPLAATVFAKGSRNSIQEAKDYAQSKLDEGIIDEDTFTTIVNLIENYSKWR